MSRFGERLKAFREERGLTQVELAVKAGVSPTTITRLEIDYRGGNRPGRVSVGTLEKLARVLDVPTSALLDDPDCHTAAS